MKETTFLTSSKGILGLEVIRYWLSSRFFGPPPIFLMEAGEEKAEDRWSEPYFIMLVPNRIPSNKRIKNRLEGSSSILLSTRVRHSGHLSSLCDFKILWRQGLQKVCWHGSTLAEASSFSRHTGHSSMSDKDKLSMMILMFYSVKNSSLKLI